VLGLHDDVVDIDLQVAPDLPYEIGLHTLMFGGMSYPGSERGDSKLPNVCP
jgi:hypothetical protein